MSTQTVVLKLGTQVVTQSADELAFERLESLIANISELSKQGTQFLVVSSGAVGLGRKKLKLGTGKLSTAQKQVAASVGQAYLMNFYCEAFQKHNIQTAQVLVTSKDFSDRNSLLNLSRLFEELAALKIIPILNENDATSIAEISEDAEKSFGDNDRLAALLSSQFGADTLILLSDVGGVYEEDPKKNKNAQRIKTLSSQDSVEFKTTDSNSNLSRGGMSSKVDAAFLAAQSGVQTYIASGFDKNVLLDILTPQNANIIPATHIPAVKDSSGFKRGKKNWLSWMSGYQGSVTIDDGAQKALLSGKSLLFAGIKSVSGSFQASSVIRILDINGNEVGRGLCEVSDEITKLCAGKKTQDIRKLYTQIKADEFIHRDWMVLTSGDKE